MNEWKKSKQQLPTEHKRYLGFCINEFGNCCWTGFVEVWFDPETGWHRCENCDEKPVRVVQWTEIPEQPKE